MNYSTKAKASALLDAKHTHELSPDLCASLEQNEALQETWGLHQKALQIGESVRSHRAQQPIDALSSQGYLQRVEARLVQRKQEQSQKAWWRRVYQVAGSGFAVAASAVLLWWTPQQIAQDIALQPNPLRRLAHSQTAAAVAQKDNLDLWLQRLGGNALAEGEPSEQTPRAEDPLMNFVDAESDELAPISQRIPLNLEGVSILSEDE